MAALAVLLEEAAIGRRSHRAAVTAQTARPQAAVVPEAQVAQAESAPKATAATVATARDGVRGAIIVSDVNGLQVWRRDHHYGTAAVATADRAAVQAAATRPAANGSSGHAGSAGAVTISLMAA